PGERDELEPVAHRSQLALESRDRPVVEILLPVERRRAVVREHLPRIFRLDRFGKAFREVEVRFAGLAPDEVRVRGVREAARYRLIESRACLVEAFGGALARAERLVVVVDVG